MSAAVIVGKTFMTAIYIAVGMVAGAWIGAARDNDRMFNVCAWLATLCGVVMLMCAVAGVWITP